VPIVDETAGEKSSADCAGAARQYSGTVGGIALCQVAVTLTYASARGHALIGRALYLPEGASPMTSTASWPGPGGGAVRQQAAAGCHPAGTYAISGIRAAFVAGDEVYGGRELRRSIRDRGMSYCMAVRASHTLDRIATVSGVGRQSVALSIGTRTPCVDIMGARTM
jgi:SRSO17 transposase